MENGDVYDGEFVNGYLDGRKLIWKSENTFKDENVNGTKYGRGMNTWENFSILSDGDVYGLDDDVTTEPRSFPPNFLLVAYHRDRR